MGFDDRHRGGEVLKILLAHPGTQYSYRQARQFARRNLLYEFWTGFAIPEGKWSAQVVRALPERWERRLANRVLHGVPPESLRTLPLVEWRALRRLGRGEDSQCVLHERNETFQRRIPERSLSRATAIVGFDTSSWLLADRAARLGKPFVLDRSIAHPRVKQTVLRAVERRYPAWSDGTESRLPHVLACEQQEHDLAMRIVVPSTYASRTLLCEGVPEEKVVVNPFGVDASLFHPPAAPRVNGPLRFLFLGSISARKGVPVLIDAWRSLKLADAELWIAGPARARERRLIPDLPGLRVHGSSPHAELPALLRQCDVLVLPSFCEGLAQVLLEALASGLPIIATDATGAEDLIQDGREGFLIRAGDGDALAFAMRHAAENRDRIQTMSRAARQCAARFSWESYGDRWNDLLHAIG